MATRSQYRGIGDAPVNISAPPSHQSAFHPRNRFRTPEKTAPPTVVPTVPVCRRDRSVENLTRRTMRQVTGMTPSVRSRAGALIDPRPLPGCKALLATTGWHSPIHRQHSYCKSTTVLVHRHGPCTNFDRDDGSDRPLFEATDPPYWVAVAVYINLCPPSGVRSQPL